MKIDRPGDYYKVSLERMSQAWKLYQEKEGKSYALAMYAAGVAVECMLRAFKMLKDPTFDERHDLDILFKASGMLVSEAVLREKGQTEEQAKGHLREMEAAHAEISRLWSNDYRFASEKRLRAHLKRIKFDRKVKGDLLKEAARRLLSSSQKFVSKGVIQWNL